MDRDINAVCEAVNCFAPATKEVRVKVGRKGSIYLLLCKSCQSKFQEGKPDE